MKKIGLIFVCVLIALCSLTVFVACDETTPEVKTLSTPTNVGVSEGGLITWDAVPNATSYVVKINGIENPVTTTYYQVAVLENDFYFTVYAKAEGFNDSAESAQQKFVGKGVTPPIKNVKVGISGGSEVKSGQNATLKAFVDGVQATSSQIEWSIVDGAQYATIDKNGKITATDVSGDKQIMVKATSTENEKCYATKVMTVVARPALTQDMLDVVNKQKISFEGYLNINLYTMGMFSKLERTVTTNVKTAMDGTNWYAEYSDASTGITTSLYYKNHDGVACQIGLSFMNDEQYVPMVDDDGENVSWQDAGLYNSLTSLSVDDFEFDDDKWRWMYVGSDAELPKKLISSANPYDFDIQSFGLIVDEGEVMGIYAVSNSDNTIMSGYTAIQELFVAINVEESTVVVPTISKFTHDAEYDEIYDRLQTAIDNMHALESYSLQLKETTASYLTSGYTQSGFDETITSTDCYFVPFSVAYDAKQNEIHNVAENSTYGYKKINDALYNAYYQKEDGSYSASRAFEKDFATAKPSFAFSSEIFRSFYEDEEAGTTTYYSDSVMCGVASTFYHGVGNDINLYGIFATTGYTSQSTSFTPFVVVKDGYIVEAAFYFYLGSIYGVVELEYGDFNTASVPADVNVEFETRYAPTSWSQLTIQVSTDTESGTSDDVETNALDYLKEFFSDENIGDSMPFFGTPLGDTYGFGLTTYKMIGGSNIMKPSIVFYYDVPLDVDYSINSSLTAVKEYLVSLGFERNKYDEYVKGKIRVAPVDSSLDLLIYVWNE